MVRAGVRGAPSGFQLMKFGYLKFAVGDERYVYDTTTNAIISVSSAAYAILDDYLRLGARAVLRDFAGRLPAGELDQAVHFIRSCRDSQMLRPLRRLNYLPFADAANLRRQYAKGLRVMTLGITEECNQRCEYCPFGGADRGKQRHGAMSWETVRESIQFLLSHAGPRVAPIINLYGGEPVLRWPVIERAILCIRGEMRRPDVEIRLCTNATLLDRPRLEVLMANDVILQVSLDGPAQAHDSARVLVGGDGTHARVLRTLHWIRRRNPVYYRNCVRPNCTFSINSDLSRIFRYFNGPNFRDLRVSFEYRAGGSPIAKADRVRHEAQVDELVEQYLRALREGRPF